MKDKFLYFKNKFKKKTDILLNVELLVFVFSGGCRDEELDEGEDEELESGGDLLALISKSCSLLLALFSLL